LTAATRGSSSFYATKIVFINFFVLRGRHREAKASMTDRNANVQAVISHYLENELELLGLTGVEDKLQVRQSKYRHS
jgi:hypothetical protein